MKGALGIVGAALLVLVGGVGGYLLHDDESESRENALPQGWALCSNAARGFAIGHPARWHTDAVAVEESCEYFDPEPFEVPRQSDFSGTALEVDPTQLADGRLLPAQADLPDAVQAKRVAIAKAAAARDYDALEQLLPTSGGFEYTFGGAVPGGPTSYWRRLDATTDEAPLESLVSILSLPYTEVRGLYVWPFAFDRNPKRLTKEELDLVSTFATPKKVQAWRQFGGYFGWRAAIEPDGDWVFYVAGD